MERLKCEFDFIFAYVEKEILRSEKIYQIAVSVYLETDYKQLIQATAKGYYEAIRQHPNYKQGEYLYFPSLEEYLEDILESEELIIDMFSSLKKTKNGLEK